MPAENAPAAERIIVRAYKPGDEAAILDLFERSFHVQRSLPHWQWTYRDDPYGREHISVAFDGERLVGHYSGYPVPFHIDGADVLAHQIGDTMTDTSVRHVGRGPTAVLGRTARHFYETFCEDRIAFNYGYNVANIQKFSVRFLRSDRVLPVAYRVRRAPLPEVSRLSRWLRGYTLEVVERATADFDELFERAARGYQFLIRRDARYLQWRYFDCPDSSYIFVAVRKWRRLAGWIVYRIRENKLIWGDALFDPKHAEAARVVVPHVAAAHRVEAVEGWFPRYPAWFDAELRAMDFEDRPEPQDLALMCVPFQMSDATARMRASLYYTMGDSDLF